MTMWSPSHIVPLEHLRLTLKGTIVSTPRGLTTTSYAILGLLALQSWSTYELTRQMDRSLGRIWPRATSKLYEEPKKLVEGGRAEAPAEVGGRRRRPMSPTPRGGGAALGEWLQEPGEGP